MQSYSLAVRYEGNQVKCLYCDQVFEVVEDWQRHNLQVHMARGAGVGPLPEERTEETEPPAVDRADPPAADRP
jgi:hypothetical protein